MKDLIMLFDYALQDWKHTVIVVVVLALFIQLADNLVPNSIIITIFKNKKEK